jgi:hypothetical protein
LLVVWFRNRWRNRLLPSGGGGLLVGHSRAGM